ncbi:MAG: AAA family ATPase [Cyanobacteria bacterium P01_A01_bin.123]
MIRLQGYQVAELVYSGSKTLLYRGHRLSDHQPVLIKLLKAEYPSFSELVRFRNQYTITKALNLPGVVQPLALENYRNHYALVMPDEGYVALAAHAQSAITLPAFFPITLQLSQILQGIHRNRVIHKDIKPHNILIHPETGHIKLIDFSLSSLLPKETPVLQNPHILEGTLAYLAPEQTGRMNRGIDYRTDFYALGITFYELLTGQLPFQTTDPMELVHCHIAQQPRPPATLNPAIPLGLNDLILKLMAKTAEDRYQSAFGLRRDLEYCQQTWRSQGDIPAFPLGRWDVCDRFTIPEKLYGRKKEVQALLDAFERVAGKQDPEFSSQQSAANQNSSPASPAPSASPTHTSPHPLPPLPQSELFLVAGFSGIGKTALVNEVHKPIVRQRGYFIKGKFDQYQRNIPFSAFVQALRDLMRQLLTEPATVVQVWKTQILNALTDNGQVLIEVIPELEWVIGPQSSAPELSGTAAQNRFNLLFQKFIQVFTTPAHPLVIFLDDLQWADSASLKLIQLLIAETETAYLLLLGAYRDNEVYPAHPLMLTLGEIEKQDASVDQITLAPLTEASLNEFIADTLICPPAQALPLTELIFQKTAGNPFFATQFLKSLYQDGLISFDYPPLFEDSQSAQISTDSLSATDTCGRGWQCDIAQIRALAVSNNVVEFMSARLQRLSPPTQAILKLAACIGNLFDLTTLAIVYEQTQPETATDLWQALQEGLILPQSEVYKFYLDPTLPISPSPTPPTSPAPLSPTSPAASLHIPTYKFLHDRVQQAAYTLIPEAEKQSTHLTIGRLLLKNTAEATLEERIFEIVNQLNIGADLIADRAEKDRLVQLNLIAGRKAKLSTAYAAAVNYLSTGLRELPPESWQNQYSLTLELHETAADAAYLNGDFEQMAQSLSAIFQHAATLLDKVKAHEIQIQAYIAQDKPVNAVNRALEILRELGVKLPKRPKQHTVAIAIWKTQLALAGKRIDELVDLPPMTDPTQLAAMRILTSVISPASFFSPPLFLLISLKAVNLSLKYGNIDLSAYAYGTYGQILCGVVGDIDRGNQFGQLALKLLAKLNAKKLKAKVLMLVNDFVIHWQAHLKETLAPFVEAYQSGLETGDLEFAARSAMVYGYHSYFLGQELATLEQELGNYTAAIRELKQTKFIYMNARFHQVVLNLLGRSYDPCRLVGDAYDEDQLLPLHVKANDRNAIFNVYFHKASLYYLFGFHGLAAENIANAKHHLETTTGLLYSVLFYFYESLIRLATFPSVSRFEQVRILRRVKVNQRKVERWAQFAPMNHRHKFYLVEAERHRVLGQSTQAIAAYDRAIALAKKHDYIHEMALANELAAQFCLAQGQVKFAQVYLTDAYYGYARWGAKAKVESLEAKYPEILAARFAHTDVGIDDAASLGLPGVTQRHLNSTVTVTELLPETLDLAAVLKVSQALSSEIQIEQLLSTLVTVAIETAGAEKGVLILPQDSQWMIQVKVFKDRAQTDALQIESLLQSIPVGSSIDVPVSLINYVSRTQTPLALENAAKEVIFAADPYIIEHQPKSVLCNPILSYGNLVGILYLENNLVAGVFTHKRLEVLKLLMTQAAISLENAQLYEQLRDYSRTLESRIEARTEELQAAKQDADIANRAKSQFLANMSHELRTPLNAILGFTQLMNRDATLSQTHQNHLQIISRSGEHLLNLINDVLEFSKIEAGRITFSEGSFNLLNLLTTLENMFQLKASSKGLRLSLETSPDLPRYIKTDEGKFRQVLINLLSNAIKFTSVGQVTLRIKVERQIEGNNADLLLCCEVEDTGPGIPETEVEVLFDAFVQTEPGRKSQEGTGLGLPISREFVRLMGGDMTVSNVLNGGALFRFTLQAKVAEAKDVSLLPTARQVVALAPNQPIYRLLVVEDQWTNRQLLVEMLADVGFEVREAENGKEAIALYESWHPHLIWMDMRMPGMDGYEATRRIKADAQDAQTRESSAPVIIALTASAFEEERAEILAAGCDDFVRKPLQTSMIFDKMAQLLGVKYIYAENHQQKVSAHQSALEFGNSALKADSLSVMPQAWIEQLYEAAIQVDADVICQLLAQIPAEHAVLAETLLDLTQRFCFDEIIDLTQVET